MDAQFACFVAVSRTLTSEGAKFVIGAGSVIFLWKHLKEFHMIYFTIN